MILFICTAELTGCRFFLPEMKSPLPDDPIVYQTGEFYTDSDSAYVTIQHGGKFISVTVRSKRKDLFRNGTSPFLA